MAPAAKHATLQLSLVGLLAAVLVLLAVLQYRWSLEISRAERTRIEGALSTSVGQFRQEFYRELAQISTAFRGDPMAGEGDFPGAYAERYEEWSRNAARPDLLTNVYVWREGRLLRLDASAGSFEPADWPPPLAILRAPLENESRQMAEPPAASPGSLLRSFSWTLEERGPALVRGVFDLSGRHQHGAGPRSAPPRLFLGFIILELNRPALERMLGDLAQRYFSGPDGFVYNVAVVDRQDGQLLYRSDAQISSASLTPPDARAALLPSTPGETRVIDLPAGGAPFGRRGPSRRAFAGRPRGTAILPSGNEEPWELLARHKGGSLEAVVAANQRRNLFLSFGVLVLLAVSMALIILSAVRARRLARLQMEFVAGVSHELRTPVAVISSAADNLAEGFVGTKEQVKEYGAMIRHEGRRLAGMIEQMLDFAAGQSRPAKYTLGPVAVPGAIGAVMVNVGALPEAEGFRIERESAPDLPPVMADARALNRCLENLVLNALKYSGESRWVRIRATVSEDASRVRISVEDGGPGIEPADLPHIFEPFYRGKAAQSGQIHGTGLGLSLARDIAEGMGGRLEVSSELGRGSVFTIELPAAGPEGQGAAQPLSRTA